jgi:hypothetical protein
VHFAGISLARAPLDAGYDATLRTMVELEDVPALAGITAVRRAGARP